MRSLVFAITLVFITTVSAQEKIVENDISQKAENEIVQWENSLEEAISKSSNEDKPILIYFTGSDWCGPCIQLDEKLFHTEKFTKYAKENLVLYMADFPRNRDLVTAENRKINKQLSKKYNQSSFPTLLFINYKGEVLGRKNGAYMPEYYFPFFEEIVKTYQ